MVANATLPYNKYLIRDLVMGELIRISLEEDWSAQQLYRVMEQRGYLTPTETYRMRRYLHTLRVFETEIRMREQARGLYS